MTKRSSYSFHIFCHFRMRNPRMSYTHPTKIATPPLVPPCFSRSVTFCDEKATAEMKMRTSETQQTLAFIFFLENGMIVRAHLLVPLHFLGSTALKKMRWKDESGDSFPKLSNDFPTSVVDRLLKLSYIQLIGILYSSIRISKLHSYNLPSFQIRKIRETSDMHHF